MVIQYKMLMFITGLLNVFAQTAQFQPVTKETVLLLHTSQLYYSYTSMPHRTQWLRQTVCTVCPANPFLLHESPCICCVLWSSSTVASSQHTPYLLKGRAHLSTGQCSGEGVVTNGNGLLSVVHIHLSEENEEVNMCVNV